MVRIILPLSLFEGSKLFQTFTVGNLISHHLNRVPKTDHLRNDLAIFGQRLDLARVGLLEVKL